MYLKSVGLKDFRKFESEGENNSLTVNVHAGLNVIVGENDSGKTAIIDAIKLLLGTVSEDFDRIYDEDFYCISENIYKDKFRIEGIFSNLNDKEAGLFLEWLSFDDEGEYELRLILEVQKKKNDNGQEYIERQLLAGEISCETKLDSKARSFLKATYLKPLRDANTELRPGIKSRLAQILRAHSAFKTISGEKHQLETIMQEANEEIEAYFSKDYEEKHSIKNDLESILDKFYDIKDKAKTETVFSVSPASLKSILNKLSLNTSSVNLGLGNMNLLFIATELILLNNHQSVNIYGPHITLIEEIEAHLHTQAQIRLIKYLEEILDNYSGSTQFILTSHSTNLVSSINPENLIYLHKDEAYSLAEKYTMLDNDDYKFLERFLDATKCNLFFAKGLIFVEGDSELLLIPAIAELVDIPLHKYGVSLVNVGGTSFERYVKLFSRNNSEAIKLPISLVTDMDILPLMYYTIEDEKLFQIDEDNKEKIEKLIKGSLINYGNKLGKAYTTLKSLKIAFDIEAVPDSTLIELTQKDISEANILLDEKNRVSSLESKYSQYNANVKVFVAPKWTLEYSLLYSPLGYLLKDSIFESQYKFPLRADVKAKLDAIETDFNGDRKEEAIYDIFKRLDNGQVSKAIVAQLLTNKILGLDNEARALLKENVLKDEYVKYLVKAINHASGIAQDEGEADE